MDQLDLSLLTEGGRVKNLTGRLLGQKARKHFQLEKLDASEEQIEVLIPEHVYLVTPSFFIGLFAESFKGKASVDEFFAKYRFSTDPSVLRQVEEAAQRTLHITNSTH